MKSLNKNPAAGKPAKHKSAPEIRDNLDSRKNEEQDYKGDDVTHNKRPHNNKVQEKKKKPR